MKLIRGCFPIWRHSGPRECITMHIWPKFLKWLALPSKGRILIKKVHFEIVGPGKLISKLICDDYHKNNTVNAVIIDQESNVATGLQL